MFSHLDFYNVYRNKASIKEEDYFICNSIVGPDHLLWQYCSHMQCHPVDFASMCMVRAQLPIERKEIRLPNFSRDAGVVHGMFLVHPGRHWASKTFPAQWWVSVLEELVKVGLKPVIVGKHVDETIGYVDFEAPEGCLDMRDQLSLAQFLGCAKYAKYVLSNDSAIIHAAAAGDAHIGIVASVKHPDYLKHWRHGQFGYKTTVFGNDGVWNHVSWNPVQVEEVNVMNLPEGLTWDKILPEPSYIASCVRDS
jgi:ADP-heptose:LPS heptosyltransferase